MVKTRECTEADDLGNNSPQSWGIILLHGALQQPRAGSIPYPCASFHVAPSLQCLYQMTDVLLCSNNQLLAKSLYGMLRDEGYSVETADHPAMAVQMVLRNEYTALIIDFEPFGLSVDDAVRIIRTIRPEIIVLFIGDDANSIDGLSIEAPVDLAEFRQTIQTMHRLKYAK